MKVLKRTRESMLNIVDCLSREGYGNEKYGVWEEPCKAYPYAPHLPTRAAQPTHTLLPAPLP